MAFFFLDDIFFLTFFHTVLWGLQAWAGMVCIASSRPYMASDGKWQYDGGLSFP